MEGILGLTMMLRRFRGVVLLERVRMRDGYVCSVSTNTEPSGGEELV